MSKKRIFLIVIACFLVLGMSFGVTYAYLIAKDKAVNQFTIGENIIEIFENYEPPEKLEPGVEFQKEPYVKNTGNLPCFVRMRADFSNSKAEEFCESLNIDTENWEYNSNDGYYYYKNLLNPNDVTEPLFTKVKIKSTINDSDIVDFDILIYAESCQHNDHDGECSLDEYKTVWDKEGN